MRARGLTPASRTLDLRASSRPARGSAASSTSRRPSRSSRSSACGSPTASRWRSSSCTCAQSLVPGLTRGRPRAELVLRPARRAATTIEIVGGTQTVEPTVTNEEESAALGVPLHSPALLFERVTRSADGRDRRVHELDLPRRPLPARHRARRSAAGRAAAARDRRSCSSADRYDRKLERIGIDNLVNDCATIRRQW